MEILVTKEDYNVNYRDYGNITVPKGTRLTNRTAMGIDPNYNFVDGISWIPPHENGTLQYGLIHDVIHYGINVPKEYVKKIVVNK